MTDAKPTNGSVNSELLMSMMNCVDTSLFSAQQVHNWEQMKLRIKLAAEQNAPLAPDVVHDFIAKNAPPLPPKMDDKQQHAATEFRAPSLHREASIQDVLACLLEQQAPTARMMHSSGGSFLLNANRQQQLDESKPSLKSLLSSNDFSMTEKKESLRHLLSFIDNSFASTAEPMTQVYKDCEEGTLQRLSSLQLMRQFMPVTAATGTQSMGGRTTSFEIIQAMLNATSNQAIQKPMSSQDSFRFQHLARTLESIETDVGYDNEDYGGDDVVQVDNLDNLLDYHGPSGGAQAPNAPPPPPSSTVGMSAGFVDTQALLNQSRSVYSDYGGYQQQQQQQQQYGQAGGHNGVQSMYAAPPQLPSFDANGNLPQVDYANGQAMAFQQQQQQQQQQQLGAAQNIMKLEQSVTQHQALQQQLLQQQQKFDPQKQFNQFQYQSALLPPPQQPGDMMMNSVNGAAYANGRPQDAIAQQQQFTAMMLQHHQQNFHNAQRIPVAASQAKQQKPDAPGGQICSALGCNHPARVKGMCKLHGGGRRCKVEGCMKSAQTGHLCIAHGGGKPCNVEGCPKTAQSRGLCKQHGGGVRCKFEGCTKSCQSGGFCRGHGGGKRCEYPNCTKWAQKNGHCAKHAQEISQKATLVHP